MVTYLNAHTCAHTHFRTHAQTHTPDTHAWMHMQTHPTREEGRGWAGRERAGGEV